MTLPLTFIVAPLSRPRLRAFASISSRIQSIRSSLVFTAKWCDFPLFKNKVFLSTVPLPWGGAGIREKEKADSSAGVFLRFRTVFLKAAVSLEVEASDEQATA